MAARPGSFPSLSLLASSVDWNKMAEVFPNISVMYTPMNWRIQIDPGTFLMSQEASSGTSCILPVISFWLDLSHMPSLSQSWLTERGLPFWSHLEGGQHPYKTEALSGKKEQD
jgi:hypothetical protein